MILPVEKAISPKIYIVTPWYGEFAGGAETLARNLAIQLTKAGREVEVLTTCCRAPFLDWWTDHYVPGTYEIQGVVVRRFRVDKDHRYLYEQAMSKIALRAQLTSQQQLEFMRGSINSNELIQYLGEHLDNSVVFCLPYLYGLIYFTCTYYPENTVLIPCLHDEPQAHWTVVGQMLKSVRRVVCLSPEEQALLDRHVGTTNALYLGAGVEMPDKPTAQNFRKMFEVTGQYLLYMGRKDPGKNVPLLIDYFLALCSERSDVSLVLIGGGDESIVPQHSKILSLGVVSEEDKASAAAGSLAVCNLSENESFSFVLMEAWLAGRPVIVSARGAVTVGHCRRSNGGLFVASAPEFIEVVNLLSSDATLASSLGENGRRYASENFAWPRVIKRYSDLIEGMNPVQCES